MDSINVVIVIIVILFVLLRHFCNAPLMYGGNDLFLEQWLTTRGSLLLSISRSSRAARDSTYRMTQVGIGISHMLCLCLIMCTMHRKNILYLLWNFAAGPRQIPRAVLSYMLLVILQSSWASTKEPHFNLQCLSYAILRPVVMLHGE